MKFLLKTLLAALLSIVESGSFAHDFAVDGIYYVITSNTDKTVAVTYYGNTYNNKSYDKYKSDVNIPQTVTYKSTTYNVTSIGDYAFFDCNGLTSVTIPESVTSIGNSAFQSCSGLTSVTIPESVTSIGSHAFSGCSGLTKAEFASIESLCSISFSYTSNPLYYAHHLYIDGEEVTDLVIPESVTSIGKYAFDGCSGLTSVTIGNSVTSIGSDAFSGCSGLTSVTIGNSVTSIGNSAFYNCSGLTSVTIGNSVTSIGDRAFDGCSGLTSVTISNSVTSIGGDAFHNCSGLTKAEFASIERLCSISFSSGYSNPLYYAHHLYIDGKEVTDLVIPESVTSIRSYAFNGCSGLTSVAIPESVTSIDRYAFQNCSGLTSVTIPEGVTSIGWSAFYNCSGLTSVTINSNAVASKSYESNLNLSVIFGSQVREYVFGKEVESIGKYACYGCSGLTSVTIGNSVTSIGNSAFFDCNGLTSVTIPESVTSIGNSAFYGCTGLTSIVVQEDNTKYDSRNGCNAIIETSTNTLIAGCRNTVIPESVTSIGNSAFWECGLTSVTIPNSVTSIGNSAFYNCSGLTSVTIGNSVTSIGSDAFSGCSGLTSVTIGNSVTSIGDYAFFDCNGLTSVTIPESVTSIGNSAFYNCSGLTSVTIGNSVTSIGEDAFLNCSGLTKAEFSSIEHLCNISFRNLSSNPLYYAHHLYINGEEVTSLTIPSSVTRIGNYAFCGGSSLMSVTIPNSVTSIGISVFLGCDKIEYLDLSCRTIDFNIFGSSNDQPKRVRIGTGVESIWSYPYLSYSIESLEFNCKKIENWFSGSKASVNELKLGEQVCVIGKNAFYEYEKIKSVIIPDNVEMIEDNAFYGCKRLAEVHIGCGMEEISDSVFYNCPIARIYNYSEYPQNCGKGVFSIVKPNCKLYVMEDSQDLYRVHPDWYSFNIQPMDAEALPIEAIENGDLPIGITYDLSGRRQLRPAKGLNIIRHQDGRIKKIMRRK